MYFTLSPRIRPSILKLVILAIAGIIGEKSMTSAAEVTILGYAGRGVDIRCPVHRSCSELMWLYEELGVYSSRTRVNKRFIISESNGTCFLHTNSSKMSDAGIYHCVVVTGNDESIHKVYLVMMEFAPVCTFILYPEDNDAIEITSNDLFIGDLNVTANYTLSTHCLFTYNGTQSSWPEITMTSAIYNGNESMTSVQRIYDKLANDSRFCSVNKRSAMPLTINVTSLSFAPEPPVQASNPAEFTVRYSLVINLRKCDDNNAPLATFELNTPRIRRLYGVIEAKIISLRNKTLAYMGDTLKCAAVGSPPVKFQWIQLATNETVVGELSSIKVEESAILSYRCLASNVVSGLTYTAWSRPVTIYTRKARIEAIPLTFGPETLSYTQEIGGENSWIIIIVILGTLLMVSLVGHAVQYLVYRRQLKQQHVKTLYEVSGQVSPRSDDLETTSYDHRYQKMQKDSVQPVKNSEYLHPPGSICTHQCMHSPGSTTCTQQCLHSPASGSSGNQLNGRIHDYEEIPTSITNKINF